MEAGRIGRARQQIRVLHVDDDPAFIDLAAAFLESDTADLELIPAERAEDGLNRLKAGDIDCIVSDYDMPEMDGLEFLEAVRQLYPEVPFILFTGKGSEEIASEAISQGVTDYLQKGGGSERYEVLSNRIRNGVQSYRTQHELERSREFLNRILDLSPTAVLVLDGNQEIIRANDRARRFLGLSGGGRDSMSFPEAGWNIVDVDGAPISGDQLPFSHVLETGEAIHDVQVGIVGPNDQTRWLSLNAAPLWPDQPDRTHVLGVLSERTDRGTEARSLEQIHAQLQSFGHVLSHDLGNILNVAEGRLELAREHGDDDHFESLVDALTRARELLRDLTDAIEAGSVVDEMTMVGVGDVFEDAWQTQGELTARTELDSELRIEADENALLRMFENLIRNTFEHGPEATLIRVGEIPNGFFVEDDGPGIDPAQREQVFEPGFSTKAGGSGIGLPSIHQTALAHGWETRIEQSPDGGARFEFTNVVKEP